MKENFLAIRPLSFAGYDAIGQCSALHHCIITCHCREVYIFASYSRAPRFEGVVHLSTMSVVLGLCSIE